MNVKSLLRKFNCKKNTTVQLYQINGDLVWKTSEISLKKAIEVQSLQKMEVEKFDLSTFDLSPSEQNRKLLKIWIVNRQNLSPARKTSDQDGILILKDLLSNVTIGRKYVNLSREESGVEWSATVSSDSLLNIPSSILSSEVKEWNFNRESKNIVFSSSSPKETEDCDANIKTSSKHEALTSEAHEVSNPNEQGHSIQLQFMTSHWNTTLRRAARSLTRHAFFTFLIIGLDIIMLSSTTNPLMILPVIFGDIWYISRIAQKDRF